MSRRVYRTDIGTLRPVERRDDGTIRVDAFLTRCGVFIYRQPDGTVRRELRTPEQVFDKASLDSFLGVPVTNEHPPGMLDAKNARRYAVGSQIGAITRDSDHVRSRLAVFDGETVGDMDGGKVQVSCGYTCDCIEKPGVHPMYGAYDAQQTNIRGNHVAIVDRGRAGVTASARMDGWMIQDDADGTELAFQNETCNSQAMAQAPTARIEVVVRQDVEPTDLNAPKKPLPQKPGQPAQRPAAAQPQKPAPAPAEPDDDEPSLDPDDQVEDDGDDLAGEDPSGETPLPKGKSYYDPDGNLTEEASRKIAAASFAVPGKQRLPIHDPNAVKMSMRDFGGHEFDGPDEKHAAFNRINGKARQFGINTAGFEKAHNGKLDRADSPKKDTMTPDEIQALKDKAESRKEKLVRAKARVDQLETELANRDGQIASLTKDLESARATAPATKADRSDSEQARFDAKFELFTAAAATGAPVNSKMTEDQIKRAVIKHVDNEDVPADKLPPYVDALYDGAIKRSKKDAAATAAGANALAAARAAVVAAPGAHADAAADDTDEDAAKSRLRSDSNTQWQRKETK